MKVLLINGSPNQHGCTDMALCEVEATLHREGIGTERYWIGRQAVNGCIDCRQCRESGRCGFDDGVNQLLSRMKEFDGLVIGSPVYFAGPSGQLCAFLDRFFFCAGEEDLAGKPAAAVVSCRRGGASAAYDRLNKYFGISNMPQVPSQYWNQVHGNTPEEVRKDLEGLQTMRTLGRNLAWMLRCRAMGGSAPEHEPWIATNFIR